MGEDCSKEDDTTIVAMIKKSRATLQGIAASFTVVDLIGSLKQIFEDML